MAEGGGLLNRYTLVKAYRGFESLRLRQPLVDHCLPTSVDIDTTSRIAGEMLCHRLYVSAKVD